MERCDHRADSCRNDSQSMITPNPVNPTAFSLVQIVRQEIVDDAEAWLSTVCALAMTTFCPHRENCKKDSLTHVKDMFVVADVHVEDDIFDQKFEGRRSTLGRSLVRFNQWDEEFDSVFQPLISSPTWYFYRITQLTNPTFGLALFARRCWSTVTTTSIQQRNNRRSPWTFENFFSRNVSLCVN